MCSALINSADVITVRMQNTTGSKLQQPKNRSYDIWHIVSKQKEQKFMYADDNFLRVFLCVYKR